MKNNINKNKPFDEMQEKSLGKAGIICTFVTILYLTIETTYKFYVTKDISNCNWEIVLLIIVSTIFYLSIRHQKEMNLPKSVLGKTLPTEQTKHAHKKRILAYVCDAILFAVAYVIFTYIFDLIRPAYIFIEAISLLIISLLFNYTTGERRCKKYEEWENSLGE